MKIGRWFDENIPQEGWFAEVDGGWVAHPFQDTTVMQLIESGLSAALEKLKLEQANPLPGKPLEKLRLRTPFDPKAVRDAVAFEQHVEGVVKSVDNSSGVVPQWYEFPTFYFTNPHTLIPTETVMTPPPSEKLDFELEVGIVVGGVQDLSNLTPDEGEAAIFGLTMFNDWSARDIQGREMLVRLGPAKGKDFATTVGPWIVTADELESKKEAGFYHLMMQVEVNGKLIGRDSLANIGWPLGEIIAYASRNSIVKPGDLIGSGTSGGGGCLAELWGRNGELTPSPLKPGDVVTMTVEGVGTIQNTVGQPVTAPAIPPARSGRRVNL